VCDAGRLVATSAIAHDLTEQRWMAETLDATLRALQAAVDEARESEAATRRFLADAAHQLRTPVAGIQACAQTMRRGLSPEDADLLLTMLVRETSRAGALVSSLLRMARLDHGEPLDVEPVDLVALCSDEAGRLRVLRPELEVVLDPGRVRGPVLADRAACAEILGNLGDNGARHARRRVDLQVTDGPDAVLVRLRDDGPGLAAGSQERVFERFVSLDGRGGSGLGLPIARALARAMGGDLYFDGDFVLALPRVVRPMAPRTREAG
jgi:two-component system OmpR family sensor kinase